MVPGTTTIIPMDALTAADGSNPTRAQRRTRRRTMIRSFLDAMMQSLLSPPAPAGSETTRYCLRVDPITGSRMETVQCYTRAEWAQLEVDVDKEWAANGVKTLG